MSVAAKKAQAADRAASSRKKTFDDETRDALTAESNPDSSTPFVTFCKCLFGCAQCHRLVQSRYRKGISEGAKSEGNRGAQTWSRCPPKQDDWRTNSVVQASAFELLTELAALEIERLDPTQVIARDDKSKPTTAIAELTKKLSDLKRGKAHFERFTGFDGEQKSRYFAAGLKWRNRNQKKRKQREWRRPGTREENAYARRIKAARRPQHTSHSKKKETSPAQPAPSPERQPGRPQK